MHMEEIGWKENGGACVHNISVPVSENLGLELGDDKTKLTQVCQVV